MHITWQYCEWCGGAAVTPVAEAGWTCPSTAHIHGVCVHNRWPDTMLHCHFLCCTCQLERMSPFHAGCLLYVALITSRSLHHYWAQGLTVLDISLQPRLLRLPSRGLQVSLPRNTDNPWPTAVPSATSDADLHSPCSILQWHVSAPQDLPVMLQPGK